MRSKAILTVDLTFGDAGKGTTIDYLARRLNHNVCVVRYSGGHQAGHNVVLPNGVHHSFSQVGSAYFSGGSTYLDSNVIINPVSLYSEIVHLHNITNKRIENIYRDIFIHPKCLVTSRINILANRMKETYRFNKHGSCGVGIGETRSYWLKYGLDSITADNLHDKQCLLEKINLLKQRTLIDLSDFRSGDTDDLFKELLAINIHDEANMMQSTNHYLSCNNIQYGEDILVSMYKSGMSFIFEAAQGILIDENHGFHPHTTWSTVTTQHARENVLIAENMFSGDDLITLGICRTHQSRHGAGPLPTEDKNLKLSEHNIYNCWQGHMRYGYLDMGLLDKAITIEENIGRLDGIVLTHCDNDPKKVYWDGEFVEIPAHQAISQKFPEYPIMLSSFGPTYKDKCVYGDKI